MFSLQLCIKRQHSKSRAMDRCKNIVRSASRQSPAHLQIHRQLLIRRQQSNQPMQCGP